MASVSKEVVIEARPEEVWDALRDWGAVHERLVPGFVVDAKLDGEDRIVTFFNGLTAREQLIDVDEDARRLVWSAAGESLTHHNASAQVFNAGDARTRFVWVADLLPHAAATTVGEMMERGTAVLKRTLESQAQALGRRIDVPEPSAVPVLGP
jgi:carbon monoxide dehydrogenase subunit G